MCRCANVQMCKCADGRICGFADASMMMSTGSTPQGQETIISR
jgi:hypothetical protein